MVRKESLLSILLLLVLAGCSTTRHLGAHQYLLRNTSVSLTSDHKIANRGEVKDNLNKLVMQKPNSRFLGLFPVKAWLYNRRYRKYATRDTLPKSVERPVVLDTALMHRSAQNMRNYLFDQGYFYATVRDTFSTRRRKAWANYEIQTGYNYRINKLHYYISDSEIARLVKNNEAETNLQKGVEFKYSLLPDEIARITALARNSGYYRFNQLNVSFQDGVDTVDKSLFKDVASPFEAAVDYTLAAGQKRKPTMDLDMHIQIADDTDAFRKFRIGSVHVYPDYDAAVDKYDTGTITKIVGGILFTYHHYYVHPFVLYQHIYLSPGHLFAQSDYDRTNAKLGELGIFQLVRIVPRPDSADKYVIDYDIYLSRAKKHDFASSYEVSSGSTYFLGNSLSLNYVDRNLMKGANLMTFGVNVGLEDAYNENTGGDVFSHFSQLTRYYGVNANIDFPKFLAPVTAALFTSSNLPHTIVDVGENVTDRLNYFTLYNTSANFSYSWRQSKNITWTLSPVFINIIRLPSEADSFKRVLDSNAYLRNSFKEEFIEGENLSFVYNNFEGRHGRNYSYCKVALEEAGALFSAINGLGASLNDLYKIQFAQYTKLDFDGRHYFTLPHSVFAIRFFGGLGLPYGQGDALPYIKQYFSGGPYSLRGWRIRTLGPGSFYEVVNNPNLIDRTGDIKLEYNMEYRFPIAPLFAGSVKMNGALFFDAGNIWLAHPDPSYPGGNFTFNTLGQDIAANVGVGTRFDIASFLVFRVDVAMPVKEPYVPGNGGWVLNQVSPSDPTWRANNIVFNLSIGYPF